MRDEFDNGRIYEFTVSQDGVMFQWVNAPKGKLHMGCISDDLEETVKHIEDYCKEKPNGE